MDYELKSTRVPFYPHQAKRIKYEEKKTLLDILKAEHYGV